MPIIAEALNKYTRVMILVSHVPNLIKQIRIDEVGFRKVDNSSPLISLRPFGFKLPGFDIHNSCTFEIATS